MQQPIVFVVTLMLILSFNGAANARSCETDVLSDTVTFELEDDTLMTLGRPDWPTSSLVGSLPQCAHGDIVAVQELPGQIMIIIESIDEDEALGYLEKVKLAFSEEPVELREATFVYYSAQNSSGLFLTFSHQEARLSIGVSEGAR